MDHDLVESQRALCLVAHLEYLLGFFFLFSESFLILHFTFNHGTNFELIWYLLLGMKLNSDVLVCLLLAEKVPLFQYNLLKRLSSLHWISTFIQNELGIFVEICGFSALFRQSIYPSINVTPSQ